MPEPQRFPREGGLVKNAIAARVTPDHELWSVLDRVRFAISRLRGLELAQYGLTIEQSSILYILKNRRGAATMGELEHITMRQHHSISALINRMAKMGFVARERREKERHYVVAMTKEGQNLYRKVPIASLEMTFAILSPPQKTELALMLSALLDRARSLLGISYRPPFLQNMINASALEVVQRKTRGGEPFPDHELWALLDRTAFAVSRLRELELGQLGLTKEQASILYFLRNHDGAATSRELEDFTMRQQCSISTLVNRMNKMNLVSREKAAREKRQSVVITDAGQSLYRDVPIASLGMAFAALTANQKQDLAAVLSTLLEKARDLLGISHKLPFLKS